MKSFLAHLIKVFHMNYKAEYEALSMLKVIFKVLKKRNITVSLR